MTVPLLTFVQIIAVVVLAVLAAAFACSMFSCKHDAQKPSDEFGVTMRWSTEGKWHVLDCEEHHLCEFYNCDKITYRFEDPSQEEDNHYRVSIRKVSKSTLLHHGA